jgi:hypothetical protein
MYRPRDAEGKPIASGFDLIFPEPEGIEAYRARKVIQNVPPAERGKLEAK